MVEKTAHAAFGVYQRILFVGYSLTMVGRTVCSQVTGVHLRGVEGSSPYSPHSQARFLLILLHLPRKELRPV